MTDPPDEPSPFLSWVGGLEEVRDDEVPVLPAVGFLSVSLRLTADAAFGALRAEARATGQDIRVVAQEVVAFRRTITAPRE
jgi:hypothetical protein